MFSNQLNIFSWQTDKLAEAWQQLASFDFESCEMILAELLQQDPGDDAARALREEKERWKEIFHEMRTNKAGADAVHFLLEKVDNTKFEKEWGPMLLKTALKKEIIRLAEKCDLFYITEKLTIADMHAQQHNYPAAEKLLTAFTERHKDNAEQLARLADVQHEQGKFSEANHNYMLALLTDPRQISLGKIRNRKIADIIRHYGPDLAAAWLWLYGDNVPLNLCTHFLYSSDERQKKAATACYLIMMAEKARGENNSDQRVEFRKKLHDAEPLIYQAYFNFCNTGRFLSLDEL